MGTWGVSAFEGDDACDWAYDLSATADLSLIQAAFQAVEEAENYLEAPDASIALAACEVLARLQGNPGDQSAYTEEVDVWVAAHPLKPPGALLQRAVSAIDRILGENSELRDLWEDSEEMDAWLGYINNLRARLQP